MAWLGFTSVIVRQINYALFPLMFCDSADVWSGEKLHTNTRLHLYATGSTSNFWESVIIQVMFLTDPLITS